MNITKTEYSFDVEKLMSDIREASPKGARLRDMGNRIGISASTLSRMDNGQNPDLITFCAICAALDLQPQDYFIRKTWELKP